MPEQLHPSEQPHPAVFMGAQFVRDDMPALEGETQVHKILLAFQLIETGRIVVHRLDFADAALVARSIYDSIEESIR